jgi:hypothetical protein
MSRTLRNRLLAASLALLFVAGAFLIIRPALTGGSGEQSPSAGQGSEPARLGSEGPAQQESRDPGSGRQGNGKPQAKSWRIGGATVDNQYPIANFGQGFTNGRSCAGLQNLSEVLPVTVVSVSVGPSGVYEAQDCNSTMALSSTNLTTAVPCGPGVVLLPRPRSQACSVGVNLLLRGSQQTYDGTVTLVTRVTCTTRNDAPCTLLPSDLTPTPAAPVTLTVDQRIPFRGSDTAGSSVEPEEPSGETASGTPGE